MYYDTFFVFIGIRKIMREVAKNRLSDRKVGAIALVWNVMRGTYLKIHSRAEIVLQLLMDRSNLMVCDKFSQGKSFPLS